MDTNKIGDTAAMAKQTTGDRQRAAREALVEEQCAEFHFGREAEPLEELVRRVLTAAVEEAWELGARCGAVRAKREALR